MIHPRYKAGISKISILSIISFCSMCIALLPATAFGSFTTKQTGVPITDRAALYTIIYRFGNDEQDMYLPIFAKRNLEHGTQSTQAGYEIIFEDDRTEKGTAAALILSNATVVDGMYYIPAGASASFTLFAIVTTEVDAQEMSYGIRMTELPFYMGDNMQARSLNPSELQYFITPEVLLNTNSPVSVNRVEVHVDKQSTANVSSTSPFVYIIGD